MIDVGRFFAPVVLLAIASVGAGALFRRPARALWAALPCWLMLPIEYFLGQGVLATVFLGLGLAGRFTAGWVVPVLSVLAVGGVLSVASRHADLRADAARAWRTWRDAAIVWRAVALATAVFFVYGLTSFDGALWVDAPAFYLAMSRLIAGTGQLTALPGYEAFSAVGLFGELHMAALYTLGMDGTSPRVLSWVTFAPTLPVVYGLARLSGLGRRGGAIAVAVAVTSSAIASLWGSGKTDLFAIGPALGACVVVLALWDHDRLGPAPFLAGLLFGFAMLSKASYLVAFLPVLAVLMLWQRAHAGRSRGFVGLVAAAVPVGLLFGAGLVLAFGQNLVKNQIILGIPFASLPVPPFYSPATTRRLLLGYPLVLTFGRTWGQGGTLSPIVLAFLPLVFCYLRWPARWVGSRLLAVGVAAMVGLLAWTVLFPSIITLRYFQATLLILALPVAAAAEIATRRSIIFALLVPAGILTTIVATPRQSPGIFTSPRETFAAIAGRPYTCKGSHPYELDCQAQVSINRAARPGDRVLGLSYLRLWLEPHLMQTMSLGSEVGNLLSCPGGPCSRDVFWTRVRAATPGYRFILNDASSHPVPEGAFEHPPADLEVRAIYRLGHISAWEVRPRSAAGAPAGR